MQKQICSLHLTISLTKTTQHTHPNPTPKQNTGPQHLKRPKHTQQAPTTSRPTPTSNAELTNTDNNLDKLKPPQANHQHCSNPTAYHVQAHDRKPQGRSQNHHKKTKKKLTTPENVSSD